MPNIANFIALGEGFTTEFKRSMPSDLGREICAFANATGGVILIGVDDAGTVVGVRDHNRLKSQVQSISRSADPPVVVEVESAGDVLCVTVPEQHGKPTPSGEGSTSGRARPASRCPVTRFEISSSRRDLLGWTRLPAGPSIRPSRSRRRVGPSLRSALA